MPKSDLSISMLGTSLNIAADADPNYLKTLLEKYQKFVEQTKKGTGLEDPLKLAVLSGFLLCDEIEKAKNEKAPAVKSYEDQAAEQLTLGLITLLDETLKE